MNGLFSMASGSTDTLADVLPGLVGAVVGAVATLLVVLVTPLAQRRDRYDAAILTRRMAAYDRLQKVLKPTSRFDAALGVPLDEVQLATDLTEWYFSGDGLYMTAALRDLFFDFRDGLTTLDRSQIGDLASAIRTQMARDLNSRRPPLLG